MWAEKQKNGKFKFCEEYKDFMTGKWKKVSITLEKNTAAERRIALGILDEKIQSKYGKTSIENISFEKLIDKYRLYQEKSVKASTYRRNYYACETLMAILGKEVLVGSLSAQYIKEKFLATNKSAGTLNEHRVRLKALLNWGYENDYIEDVSYFRKFKPFKDISKSEKIKDKFLEHEELETLLSEIEKTGKERWLLVTKHLVTSGLRIGELIALNKSDVDLKLKVSHITKTWDIINKESTAPKTPAAIRDNFMHPELMTIVKQIILYTKKQQVWLNLPKTDIFFPGENGKRMEYYSYSKFLKETAERCLTKKVTPHVLRHTHASLLAEQGKSLELIMRRLGHASSNITKKIYVHITKKVRQADDKEMTTTRII